MDSCDTLSRSRCRERRLNNQYLVPTVLRTCFVTKKTLFRNKENTLFYSWYWQYVLLASDIRSERFAIEMANPFVCPSVTRVSCE